MNASKLALDKEFPTPNPLPKEGASLVTTALHYISSGKSIIPVGRDKRPLLKWQEFQDRIATPEEVRSWWNRWPTANIGIVTGKISSLTVVDVEKGGDISRFPKTLTIETGGGGRHLYYEYYPIKNRARVFPLTDIRSDGGYVVAPNSIHASGNKYKVLNESKMAPFPAELFNEKEKVNIPEALDGVSTGSRNESAAAIAGALLRTFWKQKETAWKMLEKWNDANIPPLSHYELRLVFNSIAQRESKKEHTLEKEDAQIVSEPLEFVSMTKVLEMGDVELTNTRAEDIVSFGYSFLDEKLTGIFKGELIILGGETGTGKSTFTANIIQKASKKNKCCVFALEGPLRDYGIKVIYFEIGRLKGKNYPWNDYRRNEIKDPEYPKYKAQAIENLKNENIFYAKITRQMDIETLEREIDQKVQEGFQLFLIDHLHYFDLLKGQHSKADYIEKIMGRIKALQNKTGARIILVVHYKKLEGRKPTIDSFKDSISIPQNADYVINLWRDRSEQGNHLKTLLSVPKSRNPNGEFTLELTFDPNKNDYEKTAESFGTYQEELDKQF